MKTPYGNIEPWMIGVGAGILVLIFFNAKVVTKETTKKVIEVGAGVLEGAVEGIGETVGVPPTNMTACELAKKEGRTWDASFECPAGDFLGWVWGSDGPSQ